MNGQSTTLSLHGRRVLPGLVLCLVSGLSYAQVPVDEDGNAIAYAEEGVALGESSVTPGAPLQSADLEELVGPIALYPDDLLAIVLPASTYPLEIVQAARFLDLLKSNSDLEPDDDWDESVVALLNYPDVIQLMNDDIDWTWRLGDAVIGQQSDVIAAVELFRDRAYAAGNLKSDEHQSVSIDKGVIEIVPVSEEIIYVPYYEPEEVVVYQPRPVYYYHPNPYPSYYYPYPAGHHFRTGYFWGVTTAFSIGWSNHYLNVYHPSYWGHPYYGRSYYSHYYRRPSISIYNSWYVNNNRFSSSNHHRDGDHWRPRTRAGSRPVEPRVRTEHYPPGGDQRRRENVARTRLNNFESGRRQNGRINTGLRERSTAERNRFAAARRTGNRVRSDGRQSGIVANSQRSPRTTVPDRVTANDTARRQAVRHSSDTRTLASSNNRAQSPANNSTRAQVQNRSRDDANRPAVRFRDRSNENRASNARTSSRTTANVSNERRARSTTTRATNRAAPNRAAVNARQPTTRRQTSRQATVASSNPRPTLRSSQARPSAPRAVSRPTQQRSPARVSQRATSPSVSAPTRSSAPRTSTPSRSTAPRNNSAPSAAAAPKSSNRASSSRSGSNRSRRSSSRPRGGN